MSVLHDEPARGLRHPDGADEHDDGAEDLQTKEDAPFCFAAADVGEAEAHPFDERVGDVDVNAGCVLSGLMHGVGGTGSTHL